MRLLDEISRLKVKIEESQRELDEYAASLKIEEVEIITDVTLDDTVAGEEEVEIEIAIEEQEEELPSKVPAKRGRKRKTTAAAPQPKKTKNLVETEQENLMRQMGLLRCHICKEVEAESFKGLLRHMRSDHKLENPYIVCCERRFGRAYGLCHMQYHQDKEAFKCGECGKLYLSQHKLDAHKKTVHVQPEMVQYQCESCERGFLERWAFVAHQKTHVPPEERSLRCTLCPFACHTQQKLEIHTKTNHTRELEIICEVCGHGFAHKYALSSHMKKSHAEATTEQCDICHKFYFNLHKHKLRVHEATEKIQCQLCVHQCTPPNMQKHMHKFHSGKTEVLTCHLCGKEYRTKRSLKEHVNGYHLGIRFDCQFCEVRSTSSGNWYNHMMQKHREEYEQQKAERKATQFSQARVKNKSVRE